MATRSELLAELDVSFGELQESIAGLTDEQMLRTWYDGWCVCDIFSHIIGWHHEMDDALERISRGERPVPEGVDYTDSDAWNARFAETWQQASPQAIVEELRTSKSAVRAAAINQVPEDRLRKVARHTASCWAPARTTTESTLRRSGSGGKRKASRGLTTSEQFVSEIDAAKAQVDAAIAGLTDEQASRREIDGWSVKDHLTHLTFWHEMRFFELSRIARGGHFGLPGRPAKRRRTTSTSRSPTTAAHLPLDAGRRGPRLRPRAWSARPSRRARKTGSTQRSTARSALRGAAMTSNTRTHRLHGVKKEGI